MRISKENYGFDTKNINTNMKVYPILVYDNKLLRKKSLDVTTDHKHLHEFIDDMYLTMNKAGGIGLSAIQIGLPLNIFVIDFKDPNNPNNPEHTFKQTFINPKVTLSGDEIEMTEGCLSIPTIAASVKRPETVEIEWVDKMFRPHKKTYGGIEGRIIQHEMDHLNGILFIDNLSRIWKSMIELPLKMVKNKEIEVPYLQR